jgi:4-hydroxybenzoate polyprenyltransferase
MKVRKYRRIMLISILCFAVSSLSFILIPFSNFRGNGVEQAMAYMVGVLFWLGLISGLVITAWLGRIRKKDSKKKNKLPGVLCFFKNKWAMQCDIAMIAAFVLFVIFQKFMGIYHWISIILLSITLFSVYLHSILNGNNYMYAIRKGVKR